MNLGKISFAKHNPYIRQFYIINITGSNPGKKEKMCKARIAQLTTFTSPMKAKKFANSSQILGTIFKKKNH